MQKELSKLPRSWNREGLPPGDSRVIAGRRAVLAWVTEVSVTIRRADRGPCDAASSNSSMTVTDSDRLSEPIAAQAPRLQPEGLPRQSKDTRPGRALRPSIGGSSCQVTRFSLICHSESHTVTWAESGGRSTVTVTRAVTVRIAAAAVPAVGGSTSPCGGAPAAPAGRRRARGPRRSLRPPQPGPGRLRGAGIIIRVIKVTVQAGGPRFSSTTTRSATVTVRDFRDKRRLAGRVPVLDSGSGGP